MSQAQASGNGKETLAFRRLRSQVGKAIRDFDLIEDGDRVRVCLSGGKDSYAMLDLLLSLQRRAPISFELLAVNLDQKQPGYPGHILPEYLDRLGVSWEVIEQDTWSVVKQIIPEGKTTCGLCSRLRRGILYRYARENNLTKIALGHHLDDIVETFFLNMLYGGTLKAMPPKLKSDDGQNIVIRPLSYCRERDLAALAKVREYPIIPCNLCGSQTNLQRQIIKQMLAEWDRRQPGRTDTIFRALTNVKPSHLCDASLFDFKALALERLQAEALS
ncbi:MAG: tRNA 2-thiocytidine(32) synthetase TtcA [Pseudomonadota bacterium]